MADKVVNTTVEKVLKAAQNGPNIEKVLKELFPDAFTLKPASKVRYKGGYTTEYIVVDKSNLEAVVQAAKSYDTLIFNPKSGFMYAANSASLEKFNEN